MYNPEKLEEYAHIIYARYEYFNNYTLEIIARRIKATGQLSAHDQQALKNIADITGDMKAITKKLAEITRMNVSDIENLYTQVVSDGVNTYKPLYDFRDMKFVPFEENDFAQQLVRNWARETIGTMLNLSQTKALCFDKLDVDGNVIGSTPLKGAFERAISEAVQAVSRGTVDFNTAMAKTVERLGGSGVKVAYGSGVNRSLSAMIRQNLLYGAKQAAQSYDQHVGDLLECDGFEVDAHAGCRPTHEFMQGQLYSYDREKTVDGVTYEDGTEALTALKDYGCLHFKTDVILGVSSPRYSPEELERIHRETTELIEYNGKRKTLYEWKQTQRSLERAVRTERQKAEMFKAAGMKQKAQECTTKAAVFRAKYDDMCSQIKGMSPRPERMRIYKDLSGKPVDKSGKSDIIDTGKLETGGQGVHYVGKIDREIYQSIVDGEIVSDDVIITDKQIQHIIDRRGKMFYEKYNEDFSKIILNPDYVFKDDIKNTALACKHYEDDGMSVNIVLRLIVKEENSSYKNSIITAIGESDKRFEQRLRNGNFIYKKP